MRAVSCQHAKLSVVDLETPTPAKGQMLLDVLRCGICGSDLHARHHADDVADVMRESGFDDPMRSDQEIVFGHEFCGEVVDHGPGSRKSMLTGSHVVVFPLLKRASGIHPIGLSNQAPGAYAEHVVVEETLAFPVPNGLSPDVSVLTEPMAVGYHAVRRGEVGKGTVAIVIGCGPVGLSVICLLKAKGVRHVVASDFSPGRRALAQACGADIVVDPAAESPYTGCAGHGHLVDMPGAVDTLFDAMGKLRSIPVVSWHHVWRAAELAGATKPKAPVIFECVGVPGVIDQIIADAPLFSRVIVVGVCMGNDQIRPMMAINKEIDLRFVLGYTPAEFRDTLHMLADGKVDASPLVTGTVGLDGVDTAFDALGDPDTHAKIVIDPKSSAAAPS